MFFAFTFTLSLSETQTQMLHNLFERINIAYEIGNVRFYFVQSSWERITLDLTIVLWVSCWFDEMNLPNQMGHSNISIPE